jgi:REP element-mobilizing transposase RayT
MVHYRRNFPQGGTFFFTVALADRRAATLVDHTHALREAFRLTRRERPFAIDAIIVLPEHLHVVMTLPADDADFSGRWRRITSWFTRQVARSGKRSAAIGAASTCYGSGGSGSTPGAMRTISPGMWITSTSIP